MLSLKTALQLTIPVPHSATLSRRAADLAVPQLKRGAQKRPLHLAIDPTGLKLFGEGEWYEADKKTVRGIVFPLNAPAWQGQAEGLAQTASGG